VAAEVHKINKIIKLDRKKVLRTHVCLVCLGAAMLLGDLQYIKTRMCLAGLGAAMLVDDLQNLKTCASGRVSAGYCWMTCIIFNTYVSVRPGC
jgi:hypothetical protein